MKKGDFSLKELKQIAKEMTIAGRSKMNKNELFAAITNRTKKDVEELVSQYKSDTKKEAEIRIWADVLKTMPNGTPVKVKILNKDKKYIKEKTGILTTIKIEHKINI
ncbi:MAG: hypothetical protein Q606_CBAC00005G0005 [Intestinibacter bartlettii DORA_8_9]|nr:MAG: hypothetical protein Q606_CBAC00005G0005 [Intestinibacter bartlettii DORA_8_9]